MMNLYHYAPLKNVVFKNGLSAVSRMSSELKKYAKRVGSNKNEDIITWLEGTFPGRSRAISVLTEPVQLQGNDPMLKKWVNQKELIAIDFDKLLKDGLIESVWCKRASDANGLNEKIVQIQPEEIDFSPLPWHLCSKKKGLFFGVIPHYFLVIKGGIIPPKYLKSVSPIKD